MADIGQHSGHTLNYNSPVTSSLKKDEVINALRDKTHQNIV
jgi:hypothetical protein